MVYTNLKNKFSVFCEKSHRFNRQECYWQIIALCLVCKPLHTSLHSFIGRYKSFYIKLIPSYEEEWFKYVDARYWRSKMVKNDAIENEEEFQAGVNANFLHADMEKMLAHIVEIDNVEIEAILATIGKQ